MGRENRSNANYSTTSGYQNTTNGFYGVAMGYLNIVNGYYGVAMGRQNIVTEGAVAIGVSNKSSGYCSTTFGFNNTSSGQYSTTFGKDNTSSGYFSLATGYKSITNNHCEISNSSGLINGYNAQYGSIPMHLYTNGVVNQYEMQIGDFNSTSSSSYGFRISRDSVYSIKISLQATINNTVGFITKYSTKSFEIKLIVRNYIVPPSISAYGVKIDSTVAITSFASGGSLDGLTCNVVKSSYNNEYLNVVVSSTYTNKVSWFAKVEYTKIGLPTGNESTSLGG